jgi:predicted metal-dependent enzyme (double-stranded beta helix superfamily)
VPDLDGLLADLTDAAGDATPLLAVRDVLQRAVASPGWLQEALPAGPRAELVPLLVSPSVSVFKAIWAEGMSVPPHDHLLWGAIGVYAGREDNEFFRRRDEGLESVNGRTLSAGDVALMGDDVIHAVSAPQWTGAIHVYGGDFLAKQRSMWVDGVEETADGKRTQAIFEAANRSTPS